METWPADTKKQISSSHSRKRDQVADYPHLRLGLVNAASLCVVDKKFVWTSIVRDSQGPRLVPKARRATQVSPETRPSSSDIVRGTVRQRAEQGVRVWPSRVEKKTATTLWSQAHFIRTSFPDVDIPTELIREELESETHWLNSIAHFDPWQGDVIKSLHCHGGRSGHTESFLLFPTGTRNTDLHILPITYMEDFRSVLDSSTGPKWTSPTPIYQVATSSKQNRHALVAVRTMSSTSFLDVKAAEAVDNATSDMNVTGLFNITRKHVGDQHLVDVKFSPGSQAVLVNGRGGVYQCGLDAGRRTIHVYSPNEESNSMFWRLGTTKSDDACLLASVSCLRRLDFRSNQTALELFSPKKPGELLTCIEGVQEDGLVRFSTTSNLFWMDERFTTRPLLAYQHDRQFDRTIGVETLFLPTPCTFLTSRKNGVITVYDACRADESRKIQFNGSPYCISPIAPSHGLHRGHTFFRHPHDERHENLTVFQLSDKGSVHMLDFGLSAGHQGTESKLHESNDTPDMKDSPTDVTSPQTDAGPLGNRASYVVDVSPVFEYLCSESSDQMGSSSEALLNHEATDKLASFWQGGNLPQKQFFTTFDIAFADEDRNSRAKFLAKQSETGHFVRTQALVCLPRLVEDAPWHYNIGCTLRRLDSSQSQDSQVLADSINETDPQLQTAWPSRLMSQAPKELDADLRLSEDVFSPRPFSEPSKSSDLDAFEGMFRATQAMSLFNSPPPIRFGYLRPTVANEKEDFERPELPDGVSLLLSDWDIGTDPRQFVYRDPYAIPLKDPLTQTAPRSFGAQAWQQPPIIVASGSIASSLVVQRSTSVPASTPLEDAEMLEPSTQILPGRYGNRYGIKKKKRLGGF